MNKGTIYLVDEKGVLTRMTPSAPPNEDHIQSLIATHPDLIGDSDGALLLIRREQPIPDSADGSDRWSLDHLFVTQGAVPVLVEVKRAGDTRLRREVVGQMLDYAANGAAYWRPGRLAEEFTATCARAKVSADEELQAFLGESDPANFWDQVDSNLQAGRIKLVFVADEIPPELARVVEFLNGQMKANVRAIELGWYEGEGQITTLVPRIIGETQMAAAQKRSRVAPEPVSIDDWIARDISPKGEAAVTGARAYVAWIRALGGEPEVAKLQGSIVGVFDSQDGGKVYPLHLWEQGGVVSISFRYLLRRPGLADEAERRRHYEAFKAVLGALSTTSLSGSPGFPVERLADPAIRAALTPAAKAFVEAARQE